MIPDLEGEIWKPIPEYEGLYEVSNKGRVKALEREVINNGGLQRKHERVLKTGGDRYCNVVLCKNGKIKPTAVHKLVALAFIPNPENKPYIDHIDTNPNNNCVENLRWVTPSENMLNPLTRKKNSDTKIQSHKNPEKYKDIGNSIRSFWNTPEGMIKRKEFSERMTGRKVSSETRLRLSVSHKGKPISEEAKRKASLKLKGHSVSLETRIKISKTEKETKSKQNKKGGIL